VDLVRLVDTAASGSRLGTSTVIVMRGEKQVTALEVHTIDGNWRDVEAGSARSPHHGLRVASLEGAHAAVFQDRLLTARTLAAEAVSCALAHWYFIPGIRFQRYRLKLGLASVLGRHNRALDIRFRFSRHFLSQTRYMQFDFAWRQLMRRQSVGAYLDVASPWLFPLAVLERLHVDSATCLVSDDETTGLCKALVAGREAAVRGGILVRNIHEARLEAESFDVVTSLSWIDGQKDDVGALKELWSKVRPGGALLLSLPCRKTALEEEVACPSQLPASIFETKNLRFATGIRRLYDMRLLKERIFSVVGIPARYELLGEQTAGSYRAHILRRKASGTLAEAWQESRLVGRDWRAYSTLDDLAGEGVMAIKFVKPEISQC